MRQAFFLIMHIFAGDLPNCFSSELSLFRIRCSIQNFFMKLKNPYLRYEEYNCFGCAPENPVGLKMNFELDGEFIRSEWIPSPDFVGFHQLLHGGILAAVMDEIASWTIQVLCKTSGFTQDLNVRFLRPAQIQLAPFRLEARIMKTYEKHAVVEAKLFDSEGTLCTTAVVDYYLFSPEVARDKMYYPGVEEFFE